MIEDLKDWLPLIVAFVAGIFALFQIRANNVTNARIKWLENLKQLISEFISECSTLQFKISLKRVIDEQAAKHGKTEDAEKYLKELNNSIANHLKVIDSKYNLIMLNLNPKAELHEKLEKQLIDFMEIYNEIPKKKTSKEQNALIRKVDAHSDTLILLVRYISKLEWEKTKKPYLLKVWSMKFGTGKKVINEALNLELLPERPEIILEDQN